MAYVALVFGLLALALLMNALHDIHKGLTEFREMAADRHEELMSELDVQPPLADETPQPVKVTLIARPTNEDWNKFYDYEATQRNALKELEEN